MTRSPRRLMPPAAGRTPIMQMEIEQFAKKLHEALARKGWSASDLAAAIWGRTTDARGYDVARGRDRISVYLQGKSIPDPKNLLKIAEALGIAREDLAPDITASAVEKDNPEMAMTAIAGHADKVLLRVNKLVTLEQAVRVMNILSGVTP